MAIATINPATGETLKTYEPLTEEALEEKIARAADAWATYRLTTPEERVGWLRAAADVLDADADAVAELMTTEMGKTLAAAKAEVAKLRPGPEPVWLRVDAAAVAAAVLEELKHVLENFPGESDVVLEMATRTGRRTLRLGPSYRVSPTASLRAELELVLGTAALPLVAEASAGVA